MCDAHATEISKLGFCASHRKLAESHNMCEDCSSSSSSQPELSNKFAFFPWMKQIGMVQGDGNKNNKVSETVELEDLNCSCCGVKLEEKIYPPYLLIKPSWDILDYTQKGNLIEETGVDGKVDEGDLSDQTRSDFVPDQMNDEPLVEDDRGSQMVSDVEEDLEEREGEADGGLEGRKVEAEDEFSCYISSFDCKKMADNEDGKVGLVIGEPQKTNKGLDSGESMGSQSATQIGFSEEKSSEIVTPKHLEFYIDGDDCHLIPVDFMNSRTTKNHGLYKFSEEDQGVSGNGDVILDFNLQDEADLSLVVESRSSEEPVTLLSPHERIKNAEAAVLELVENEEQNSTVVHGDLIEDRGQQVAATQATQTPLIDIDDVHEGTAMGSEDLDKDDYQLQDAELEDILQIQNDETDAEISIGTEIPDHEPIDDIPPQEDLSEYSALQESPSTSSSQLPEQDDDSSKQAEEVLEFKTMTIETREYEINTHVQLSAELHEIEEDKVPDTPTSIDSLHQLHKRLLLLERKESGTEDSLDGSSVISDIEGGDGALTVEKLKSALRAERKALNALYSELEEERSASAIAANQTMAMINRLQEEKAAMQMEALQYQRMMEEQAEYDQEALQLLNELMVKREREKAELEKELETYRKKVQEYETKEKISVLRRRKDAGSRRSRTSSASCSNGEDSDGISIELNQESKEEDSFCNGESSMDHNNQNTPVDAVVYLEESLANFEEERLSILEQLKVLEEKLFTLNEEEGQHFEDIEPIEHLYGENGNGHCHIEDFDYKNEEANGVPNGHPKEINGKQHQERRITVPKAKRLLPLFDAIDAEATEDGELNGDHDHDHDRVHDYDENGFYSFAPQNSPVSESELENKRFAIEEEVDHVYERLQALEADREFLKHCISSLRKGDKGVYLLQEILQHLKDLRNVGLRVRTSGDGAL